MATRQELVMRLIELTAPGPGRYQEARLRAARDTHEQAKHAAAVIDPGGPTPPPEDHLWDAAHLASQRELYEFQVRHYMSAPTLSDEDLGRLVAFFESPLGAAYRRVKEDSYDAMEAIVCKHVATVNAKVLDAVIDVLNEEATGGGDGRQAGG